MVDHKTNCDHSMFSRIEHVRAHFYREHWDFGVWENERRWVRTFDDAFLKCQNGCGFTAHKLEEVDDHVLTPGHCFNHAYNLHRFEEVKVLLSHGPVSTTPAFRLA